MNHTEKCREFKINSEDDRPTLTPTIAIADLLEIVVKKQRATGARVPRTITHCLFRLRKEAEFQSRFPAYREVVI